MRSTSSNTPVAINKIDKAVENKTKEVLTV